MIKIINDDQIIRVMVQVCKISPVGKAIVYGEKECRKSKVLACTNNE